MLRGILVVCLYGVGAVMSFQAVAFACSYWIWSEIFRPISFARRWVDLPEAHLVTAVLLVSIFIRKWDRRWNITATTLCLVLVWIFVSMMLARFRVVGTEYATMYAKYLIPLVLISISLTTRFAQNLFVWTLAASVGIYGAQAGLHAMMRGQPNIWIEIRGGQMTDRNDFMVAVVASLPLLAYAAWFYNWVAPRTVRLLAKGAFVLSIAAIFFSLSRGAVIGLVALTGFFVLATGRFRRRLIIGCVLVMVTIPLIPDAVTERMTTIDLDTSFQTEGSASDRLAMIGVGVRMTLANSFVGVGPGNFPYAAPAYGGRKTAEPHNIWLKASGEYGFPMLVMFVLLLVVLLLALGRERKAARRAGDRETEMLATTLSCSIIGFIAAGSFTSQFLSEYLWAILSVSGAFVAHRKYQAKHPETIEPEEATPETAPAPRAPAAA